MTSARALRRLLESTGAASALVLSATVAGAQERDGLRVLQWNVGAVSVVGPQTLVNKDCSYGAGVGDDDCHGKALANAMLQSDYDVLVLNELFDDGVRAALTSTLSGRYPYWANRFDANEGYSTNQFDDSGLAIFSRVPFEMLSPGEASALSLCSGGAYAQANGAVINVSTAAMEGQYTGAAPPTAGGLGAVPVAFDGYGNCSSEGDSPDCSASKGIGYARFRRRIGEPYHVFFTHLQSGNAPAHRAARNAQFPEASRFMNCALDAVSADRVNSPVLFVGDLNINGFPPRAAAGQPRVYDPDWLTFLQGSDPATIGRERSTAGAPTVLSDIWAAKYRHKDWSPTAWEGKEYDPGLTWDRSAPGAGDAPLGAGQRAERLDYALLNNTPYRVNHLSLAYDVRLRETGVEEFDGGLTIIKPAGASKYFTSFGGSRNLSDHLGLAIEITRPSLNGSSPFNAIEMAQAPGVFSGEQTTKLTSGGQYLWYSFKKKGTYRFSTDELDDKVKGTHSGVIYRVYTPADLSRPMKWTAEEKETGTGDRDFQGREYAIPKAPFFVKVMEARTEPPFALPFTKLRWQRATCERLDDACQLVPSETDEDDFLAMTRFYEVRLDPLPPGSSQSASIEVWADTQANLIDYIELLDAQGAPVMFNNAPVRANSPTTVEGHPTWTVSIPLAQQVQVGDERRRKFFVRAVRSAATQNQSPPPVIYGRYLTNLTYLYANGSMQLSTNDVQEFWEDEIYSKTFTDTAQSSPPTSCNGYPLVGNDFEEDSPRNIAHAVLEGASARRFVSGVSIDICEDDSSPDPDEFVRVQASALPQRTAGLVNFPQNFDDPNQRWELRGGTIPAYRSRSEYFWNGAPVLSHKLPSKPCTTDAACAPSAPLDAGTTFVCKLGSCCNVLIGDLEQRCLE